MIHKEALLKAIPQMEKILQNPLFANVDRALIKHIAQETIEKFRQSIIRGEISQDTDIKAMIIDEIQKSYTQLTSYTLKPLINATGVVLQTNLGRSIFHPSLLSEILPSLQSYTNLEYDLECGKRGERYSHITDLLCAIFGVESALVVNNNAAAVFLILNTFANNKEVILSRGELIEIGGSFRIPEIMKNAGARLVEVGATNKTKMRDYLNAINENSAMIMKAHKSNFDMIGFVEEVDMNDLSMKCKEYGLIDYFDLGSGYFKGILCNEPSLLDICKNPPSLLSFSGDKLFGSIQAGIILGKKELIEKLKQNHLLRALRVDKITLLILQATLKRYIQNKFDEIPTLCMLGLSEDELHKRAKDLADKIDRFFNPKILPLSSLAGGGSLPNQYFKSYGLSLEVQGVRAFDLEKLLRKYLIIARILDNKIAFDMRTIQQSEIARILDILECIKNDINNLKNKTSIDIAQKECGKSQ